MDKFLYRALKFPTRFLGGALLLVFLLLSSCQASSADFTITLGGDIMLARSGRAIFKQQGSEIDPWQQLKNEGVISIGRAASNDLFMANLESPFGEQVATGELNLCSNPSEVRVLQGGQLDILTIANNHTNDCTKEGAFQTGQIMSANGLLSVGMGGQPLYLDTPQGKIALLATEDVTAGLDLTTLLNSVSAARENAGLVIVSIHWGNEYQAGPDERQQALAQNLADAGADVIWGHHPHVLQKMECLTAADGRQALVIYSLGNLLSDQWMLEDAKRSALIRLTVQNLKIRNIEVIPIALDRQIKVIVVPQDSQTIMDRLQIDEIPAFH